MSEWIDFELEQPTDDMIGQVFFIKREENYNIYSGRYDSAVWNGKIFISETAYNIPFTPDYGTYGITNKVTNWMYIPDLKY